MSTQTSIASQILGLIQAERMQAGDRLPAQMLADRLRVSRSPISAALEQLHAKGILGRQHNRGYFLSRPLTDEPGLANGLGLDEADIVTSSYFRIADDLLCGALARDFTESSLRSRYGLTQAQFNAVLARIGNEGWAERKPGYGWTFSSMMTTPDSLLQSYRLRLALEPAALLEPGFRLDGAVLARCQAAERHLLAGGIETDTADQLHDRGVNFHESLVKASGNPFFIDTIRRVNRVRRLLSYRSMKDRKRYRQHCEQHLHILDLLAREQNEAASVAMRLHLQSTLDNLGSIRGILDPAGNQGSRLTGEP